MNYTSPPITPEGLIVIGFRRDDRCGHAVYVRDSVSDVAGCHLSLHLLPFGGEWIVEIHNWQTKGGEPVCGVDQRVGLHKRVRTYHDVRQVMAVAAERWADGTPAGYSYSPPIGGDN